ncbi:hypothetical protein KDA_02180 [Dictyobacter alpinus]|uniref:CusB-like beta-barrel domain-containing protein n=1 Tax=Dictyobacter alpinus TaxID=2014873 RepID=A0A402B057_9CHLR|nr:efflux RND transporter periplasmic adaptor subunit [Dictyobacter alpinus]GCE24734.1 hypothetical protein KDA_02180 [Dictyobacter alpinus]
MDERRSQVLPEYTDPSEAVSKPLPKQGKEQLNNTKDQYTSALINKNTEPEIKKAAIKVQRSLPLLLRRSKVTITNAAQQFQQQPRRIRTLSITALIAVVALIAIILYTLWYSLLAVQQVTVFNVGRQQQVTQNVGGGGLVDAKQSFNVQFPLAERIMDVLVKPGDHIKRNQALLKLDPSQLNAQIQQAANDVTAAQVYLNSVTATAINPVTIAQAQQAYQVANNRYHALLAQTNNPTLHSGTLISPVDGTVITVLISPGEVFAANAILMTLMDQSSVVVHTQIPLANLQQIQLGAAAHITPSALPDVTLEGKVTGIIPQANAQTDTFQVDVTVPNNRQLLLPGMSTYVRLEGKQTAFIVPRIAVLNPDHESSVFLVQNGHAFLRQVHVAGSAPDVFYVDSGLNPNDQIVVLPLNRLHHGQAITVNSVEH